MPDRSDRGFPDRKSLVSSSVTAWFAAFPHQDDRQPTPAAPRSHAVPACYHPAIPAPAPPALNGKRLLLQCSACREYGIVLGSLAFSTKRAAEIFARIMHSSINLCASLRWVCSIRSIRRSALKINFASSLSNEIRRVLHGLYPALYRGYVTLRDA